MRRGVLLVAVVLALVVGSMSNAFANSRQAYREAIRSMPLLERPNRFGHIYGNTVRRIYHRRHGSLRGVQTTIPENGSHLVQPAPTPVQ